jgi:hypothetical protein
MRLGKVLADYRLKILAWLFAAAETRKEKP